MPAAAFDTFWVLLTSLALTVTCIVPPEATLVPVITSKPVWLMEPVVPAGKAVNVALVRPDEPITNIVLGVRTKSVTFTAGKGAPITAIRL